MANGEKGSATVDEEADLSETMSRIARLTSRTERFAEYDRLLESFPRHAELYFRRGLSRNLGERKAAIEDMSAAIALNPAEPATLYFRGLFNLEERDFSAAIADLEQAIIYDQELDSKYYAEPARFVIAVASLHLGDFDRALRECEGLKPNTGTYLARKMWTLDEVRTRAKKRSYPT